MLQMWKENVWGTDYSPETSVFEAQPHFSTLKALLINNAQQYAFSGDAHDLSRYKQGWGRPSVREAAERAASSFIVDQKVLLGVGELATYPVDVAPGESELKITMVYPDPPGNPASALARVNDLDLRVISPSGVVYHGNVGLTAGNASVAGGAANKIDTVENVFVVDPEPGTWSVAVEAAEINEDACPVGHESICGPTPGGTPEADATFSLVVTGGTSCAAPTADITATPNAGRVGVAVQFHSGVSGGVGGPYAYSWDFEGDGVVDSTEANPVHVYARPFDGSARLSVRDAANCPVTVLESVAVSGPDLRFESFVDLTEVDGNGNGGIDPGETWELTVNLRNDGNEPAVGVTADLIPDPASAVSVTLLRAASTYADIPIGASAPSHLAYRFQVDSSAPCGERISLNLAARSTNPASAYPTEVGAIRLLVGGTAPPVRVFYDDFEDPFRFWCFNGQPGEWQIFPAGGLGVPNPDPNDGYDGPGVLGTDLLGAGLTPGNYETNSTSTCISPPLDVSQFAQLSVSYARWLNVGAGDRASFEIWTQEQSTWAALYSSTDAANSSWTVDSFDISDIADGRSRIRFKFQIDSDAQGTASGWNIDAFEILGVLVDACEPYCPSTSNTDQTDTDHDGTGDACDPDDDNDLVPDGADNCPFVANGGQADADGDGVGDACNEADDRDSDDWSDALDNCPDAPNSGQTDLDEDGVGDACDPDIDGDGVGNGSDVCAGTPEGQLVAPGNGCTIAQLCPCEGPRGTNQPWRNRGKYVSCVARASNDFATAGLLTSEQKDAIVSAAGQSECGR